MNGGGRDKPKAARELKPSGLWDELPAVPVPFIT
jgi:hypothetical protein